MKQKDEQKKIINIDFVINSYNKANPTLKPLDRAGLAKMIGCNKQLLSDWKGGRTPSLIYKIIKMTEIAKCSFEDLLLNVEDE